MSAFVAFATFCGYCFLAKVFYDEVLRKPKITYCDEDTPTDYSHLFDKEHAIAAERCSQVEAAHEGWDSEDYIAVISEFDENYSICSSIKIGEKVDISIVKARPTFMAVACFPAAPISSGNLTKLKDAMVNSTPFESFLWAVEQHEPCKEDYHIKVFFQPAALRG
jgi:hypothetical protein